jgi:hypothetical protein
LIKDAEHLDLPTTLASGEMEAMKKRIGSRGEGGKFLPIEE